MRIGRWPRLRSAFNESATIVLWGGVALAFWAPLTFSADSTVGSERLNALKPADLYKTTNLWSIHFKFTAEQWEKMEPQGAPGGFFGGGGPNGPRRGGGPGGFGPAMFIAPVFMTEGDQNHDSKLSRTEFEGVATKWFTAWDKEKTGKLTGDQLRSGISTTFMPPGSGRGGGPRGGRGPGMNLQGAEGTRNGLSSAAGIEFEYVHADLEFDGQWVRDVAVRYKGNGTFMQSRDSLKRSLKVDLGKYVKGQKLAGVSKLNLHNNVTDASWMNEVLSHRLFRDAGVPASRTAYARVYVTVPGKFEREYFGLYSMVEDVDQEFAQEHFQSKKGAIFKPVTPAPFSDLGDDWKSYNQTYDPKGKLTASQQQRLIDLCKLVSHANDSDFNARLGQFIDLDEFARFMAVEVWLSTLDSILTIGQNYYVYLAPKRGQFQFLPWDLDHSFGQFFMMGGQEERENLSVNHPWRGENKFLQRIFQNPEFKRLYLAKLELLNNTLCKPERLSAQVDEVAAAIRPAVQEESGEKLARFDQVVAGQGVAPAGFGGGFRGGGPPDNGPMVRFRGPDGERRPGGPDQFRGGGGGRGFGGPGPFGQPVKPIKAFVKARAESVAAQLAGKSEGEMVPEFGFGGPGGPGGRGGGRGGPNGPRGGGGGDFGPGMFLGNAFMQAMDANKDGALTREEFTQGFQKWFSAWDTDKSGSLTEEQLRAGINQEFMPRP